ncbi:lipoate--protein ligase family protein [Halorubrum sp. CBA1125]|uniref:lipoate--protein ligase family protein n=1 Tax=Halorubrum sp. CBA1125 TaxID=2668072 RepID=UPI0012E722F1|nr:biotin/lipoate A/B protein ligase family protein [Halorubrum sp. CBA1125]MUW14968.1 lipoate--protein ligase family protein [Halorubrum sp. CBA1125]
MTAPAGDWRLIREEAHPGPMQMALDEVAAETAADGGTATVRTYRWDPSCLTLGYRQDPDTVDWAFCEHEGIDVTRRQTGGGGIYHDAVGDIAYSIVVPAEAVPSELLDCYHLLCEPVLDAFERIGIDAGYADEPMPELHGPACYLRGLHPAHDVVAGGKREGERRKIAGNAQYRKRDAVIQHGSLTYAVTAARHLGVFVDPPVDPDAFRDRVVGMDELADIDREEAVAAVESALADWVRAAEGTTLVTDAGWTDAERKRAAAVAETKYRDEAWVRSQPGNQNE